MSNPEFRHGRAVSWIDWEDGSQVDASWDGVASMTITIEADAAPWVRVVDTDGNVLLYNARHLTTIVFE